MHFSTTFLALTALAASSVLSLPTIESREASPVLVEPPTRRFVTPATSPTTTDPHQQFSPGTIKDVTCNTATAPSLTEQDVAELAICGGIAAPINNCGGSPTTTTGTSGAGGATWTLKAQAGTINVFKGLWEECCNAARATCPGVTFSATCIGGTTVAGSGFTFALS